MTETGMIFQVIDKNGCAIARKHFYKLESALRWFKEQYPDREDLSFEIFYD